MKIRQYVIVEIKDNDLDKNYVFKKNPKCYEFRKAARGILLKNEKIALINVSKKGYHKLPGGGIENNEKIWNAFKREIREETGCNCELIKNKFQYSIVLEVRDKLNFFQISYVLFSRVVGKLQKTQFTQDEVDNGFKLVWYTVDEAIKIIKKDKPTDYKAKFIQKRDLAILNFFKSTL